MTQDKVWYPYVVVNPTRKTTPTSFTIEWGFVPAGWREATQQEVNWWVASIGDPNIAALNLKSYVSVIGHDTQAVTNATREGMQNTSLSFYGLEYKVLSGEHLLEAVLSPNPTSNPNAPPNSNPTPPQDPGVTMYQALTNALLGYGITVPSGTTLADLEALYKKTLEDQLLGQGAGVILTSNDTINKILANVQNFVTQVTAPFTSISHTFSGISAGVTDFVNSVQAGGRNIGSVITWLDQPHTLERFGAIGLGFVLFLVGLVAFIFSFVDVGEVAKTAAVAAG